jgi:GNAT superfamily N-acetyltransferase
MVRIEKLAFSRRDRTRFIDVEFALNRGHENWVPPLRFDRMRFMDPRTNAMFLHTEVAHFVAVDEASGKDVGRIAAAYTPRHAEIHGEKAGFFGFLETVEDRSVLAALLDAAAAWLGGKGAEILRGPLSYDINGVVGALIEGFDRPPRILMPWNPPWLPPMLEAQGMAGVQDFLSWDIPATGVPDRLSRIVERVRKKEGISVRTLRMDDFENEVRLVKDLYNAAWEKNWGFMPLSDEELDDLARDLKPVLDPEMIVFGEVDGEVVGFALALPDLNEALIRNRSGRLFPLGLFRFLFRRRWITYVRVFILGVVPEYRNRGLEILFYAEMFERARRCGYAGGEAGWILDDNEPMNRGIQACGGSLVARYRCYDRPI